MVLLAAAENDHQQRSRLAKVLNGDPAASPTRWRAQTWCSLFVAPCAPEGTLPGFGAPAALLDVHFERLLITETISTYVLVSKASSTYPIGKELLLQLGVGRVRMSMLPVLASPAALPGARRVSARQGWVGEKEDRFERSIVKPYEANAKSFATNLF